MAKEIVITLDPGHGQNGNISPNNTKYVEGKQMWYLANKLKAALEVYGFQVVTTRPKLSDDPSLEVRGSTAGKNGSSLFLSLHSNAPGPNADGSYSKTTTGSVVYYSLTNTKSKALADSLGNKVSEVMGHYYRGSMTRQYPDKPGVDYYGVIRSAAQSGCTCALIIEHGFHTNVGDSNFLMQDANLQKLAEAEAKVIADYFGQTKKTTTSSGTGVIHRIQLGAFSDRSLADKLLAKVKAAGFTDAYITSNGTQTTVMQTTAATPAKKTNTEIAKEVIAGKWGSGTTRKQKLTAAGYNYDAIQKLVNELMK